MSRHPNSFLFLIGMTSMCAVWLTYPFWGTTERSRPQTSKASSTPASRKNTFRYALPEKSRPPAMEESVSQDNLERIRRQLQRRAHMENSGFNQKIIMNDEMPEEVRSRFAQEKARLDELAAAYPELAAEAEKIPSQRKVDASGALTSEFKEAASMMELTGAWDQLHHDYLQQLQIAAKDESLPEEERPSKEFIEEVRAGRLIPSL